MITTNDHNMERLSDIMARVEKLSVQREDDRQAPSQASAIHSQPDKAADTTTPALPQAKVITISRRRRRQIESMVLAREERERGEQRLVYSSRPFVLCGLPVRRPPANVLLHERRNGKFFLQITGHPKLGLPFGQDRLIPIWAATLAIRQNSRLIRFSSAAELLDTFGLPKDGKTYRRLVNGFKRIFGATIFFGTEEQLQTREVFEIDRFNFFRTLRIWYTKEITQQTLPSEDFENQILLSEEFWEELQRHPIPIELNVVKALATFPAQLDFYTWLVWRCWTARESVTIPLIGASGLINQLGISEKTNARNFKIHVRQWLKKIKALWPECPAFLSLDGTKLIASHAEAITSRLPDPTPR